MNLITIDFIVTHPQGRAAKGFVVDWPLGQGGSRDEFFKSRKLLPHLARGGLGRNHSRTYFSKLSGTLAAYCMIDRPAFNKQLLDPARLVVNTHASKPGPEPAQCNVLCLSAAQHWVPRCASVARLADRRDIAVEPLVFTRLPKRRPESPWT